VLEQLQQYLIWHYVPRRQAVHSLYVHRHASLSDRLVGSSNCPSCTAQRICSAVMMQVNAHVGRLTMIMLGRTSDGQYTLLTIMLWAVKPQVPWLAHTPITRNNHAKLYKTVAQRLTRAVRPQSKPGVSCTWKQLSFVASIREGSTAIAMQAQWPVCSCLQLTL
jgi:hypothetical protein